MAMARAAAGNYNQTHNTKDLFHDGQ
jgi:hypothetical protein